MAELKLNIIRMNVLQNASRLEGAGFSLSKNLVEFRRSSGEIK